MTIYVCLWIFMTIYEDLWRFMKIYEDLWMFMKISEYLWRFMNIYDSGWWRSGGWSWWQRGVVGGMGEVVVLVGRPSAPLRTYALPTPLRCHTTPLRPDTPLLYPCTPPHHTPAPPHPFSPLHSHTPTPLHPYTWPRLAFNRNEVVLRFDWKPALLIFETLNFHNPSI